MKELAVGDRAPTFTLKNAGGHSVSLKNFRNNKNVILVFYPGDMTPGCAMQLCSIRDDWKKFTGADTAVFGVNHADADSHNKFTKKYGFPFPLLIDPGKKVSARYGAIKQFFKIRIIKRTVVGIGKDGRIFFLRRGMPKDTDILKAIASANTKP
ncbi:MAG TPA: peroxiredoxin [Candidatus Methylomirabilis sp.]|nr:peroxiredoxin [Candidatus Methylomirabilis sp.]